MRNTVLTAVVLATLAGSALAGDVLVGDLVTYAPGTRGNSGGEFITTITNRTAPTFKTFCVQLNEFLDFGSTFRVVGISDKSQAGGQALDFRTAWLYQHYRSGTLAGIGGYSYNVESSAALLQDAIWFFQNQGGANNALAQAATLAGPTSIGNVRILNMVYNSNNNAAQDVLALIPLPTGGALALAGLGGLALRRRRVD